MLSLIGFLLISATCHDVWRSNCGNSFDRTTDNTAVTILHCFSIPRNTNKFLSVLNSDSANQLSCLNGIRAITTCWIFITHCIMRMSGLWRSNVINPKAMDQVKFRLLLSHKIYIYFNNVQQTNGIPFIDSDYELDLFSSKQWLRCCRFFNICERPTCVLCPSQ